MRYQIITLFALAGAQLASAQPQPTLPPSGHPPAIDATAQFYSLPMQFEPNIGQVAKSVKFLSRGPGYTLLLTPAETVLSLQPSDSTDSGARNSGTKGRHNAALRHSEVALPQTELRVSMLGANASAQIEGLDELPGTVNYFIGNKPENWHTGIRTFAKVK